MTFTLSKEQSKRFDILKLLFAIFVVYNHSRSASLNFQEGALLINEAEWMSILKYVISDAIALCCNYGFFLMSSILLYRKEYAFFTNVKKKVKTLLIPYILMNTFWILVFWVCQSISKLKVFFGNPINDVSSFGITEWLGAYGIIRKYPFLAPMWFLKYLFILNVLSTVIKYFIDKSPKVMLFILLVLFFFVPSFGGVFMDIEYLCVWCFGYYIVKYNIKIDSLDNMGFVLLFAYLIFIFLNILIYINQINTIFLIVMIKRTNYFIGVVFFYIMTKSFVKHYDFIKKISDYNFCIYLFHQYGLDFLKKLFLKILPMSSTMLAIEYLFLPILMIVLSILFSILLKKVSIKMFSLITGERAI